MRVPYETMRQQFERVLCKYGFSPARAAQAAEIFAQNSLCGVYSHGLNRFPRVVELLQQGEVEFDFLDVMQGRQRRIRAVCTEPGESELRYVLLYEVERRETKQEQPVHIRTFGYFDVFVEGKAIAFRNEKSKELLALLVDRRGGFVTSSEAISYLWEDEEVSQLTLARYRKVALRLKNLLEEYGIAHIVETVDGKRRIVPQNVSCDLFDCLAGQRELFKGSYLLNYSWGEVTAAELLGE